MSIFDSSYMDVQSTSCSLFVIYVTEVSLNFLLYLYCLIFCIWDIAIIDNTEDKQMITYIVNKNTTNTFVYNISENVINKSTASECYSGRPGYQWV